MKLVGTLNNTNIKNIFAYIAEQGITGSLSISDGVSEKLLFIQPDKIKLFSIGERKRIKLGEVLMLMAVITEEQFNQALFIQKSTGMKLGAILTEEKIIDQATLDTALQNVLFEEVYDLLFWDGANFYFSEQADDSVFSKGELRHIEIDTDMNRFLSEISKKIDEIDVLKKWVPNPNAVYALKKNIKEDDCLAKYPGYSSKLVLSLLDGENDVTGVCENSRISSYEVYRVLSLFLSDGFIQEATKENFLVKAEIALAGKDGSKARKLLEHYEEKGGARNDILDKLALAYELEDNKQEASLHYAEAGEIMSGLGDFKNAFRQFEKAIELWPDNIDIIIHYGELLKQRDKTVEWTAQFERAAKLAEENGNIDLAMKLYRDVLERAKRSPNSKRHLARLMKGRLTIEEQQTQILCPVCETRNPRENEDCDTCGSELLHSCFSCGRAIPVSDTVCGECGGDPFKAVESATIASDTSLDVGDEAEASEFWDKKIDTYLEQSRESSSNLKYEEAKSRLKTAMILNPESEVIKKELDLVELMSRQQKIADRIDDGIVNYYSENWIPAFKSFKKVMSLIDSDHPRYSDIVSFYTETKSKAGKRNMILGIIAATLVAIFLSIYIPMEIGRRNRQACYEKLKEIRDSNPDGDPLLYRKSFGELDNFADTFSSNEELRTKIINTKSTLRGKYLNDAKAKFKAAVEKGESSGYEEAITQLENLQKDYLDVTAEELSEMGMIDAKIAHFREMIKLREDFKERQKRARDQLAELKKNIEGGTYIQTENNLKQIDGLLDMGGEVFSDEESALYTGLKKQIETTLSEYNAEREFISRSIREGLFAEAAQAIETGTEKYKGTDLLLRITSSKKLLTETVAKVNKDFNEAVGLKKKGDLKGSLRILKELGEKYPKQPRISTVKALEKEINTYISEGKDTLAEIKKALESRDVKKAYELTNLAISKYSDLDDVKSLEIPVLIESDPSPVQVKDRDGTEIGETPVVVSIPPEGKAIFSFSRKGFKELMVETDTSRWNRKIFLEKTIIWKPVSLEGRVTHSSIMVKNLVIVPVENSLCAFNPKNGTIKWKQEMYKAKKVVPTFEGTKRSEVFVGKTDFWDLPAAPIVFENELVIGGKDGKIRFVDPAEGKIKRVLPDSRKDFGSICSSLAIDKISYLMDDKTVFFGSLDKNLYAVSTQSGKIHWKKPFKNEVRNVIITEKAIWAGFTDGETVMCEIMSGMVLFNRNLGSGTLYPLTRIGEKIFSCTGSGVIMLFSLDGQEIYKKQLEDGITARPLILSDKLFCPGKNRLVTALSIADGKPLWSVDSTGGASCSPSVSGGELFIGDTNNHILCLNAEDGSVKWKYKTDGNVVSVLSNGDNLIVITENGMIYTFDLTV